MKNKKNSLLLMAMIISGGCAKSLQPPPTGVETWLKVGVEKEAILRQMVKCGFPNSAGFTGPAAVGYKVVDEIRAERCMFEAGYKYRSGWNGICSSSNKEVRDICKDLGALNAN